MKIAGIYPQEIGNDTKVQHAVSEPYGLEMILAIGKQEGHEVDLFLPAVEDNGQIVPINRQEYVERITSFHPDVAAFSLYTCQYEEGKAIATELKKRMPNLVTIAGNRYPTFLKTVEDPFDFFAVKEGEETFRDFLRAMKTGSSFEGIPGLSFKKGDIVIPAGVRPRNFSLDSLPDALRFPIIMNQVYNGISIPPLSSKPHYAIVESSRCCYNNCKFCDNNGFWGTKISERSTQRVIGEMKALKEKGIDIFYFMDLNFTAYPERTKELCNEMIKQGLNASWYCMSNTSTVDSELKKDKGFLRLMKQAGCFKIAWGIESTDDNALRRMNKRTGDEYTRTALTSHVLQQSLEAGILNQGFYILGFPWETEETILRDAEKLKDIPMHLLNIGIFTPIPLSRFYQEMKDENYTFDQDLSKHNRNTLVYNHKSLDNAKIKVLQEGIYNAFYSSPEYLKRIRQTCEIDPRFKQSFNDYFEFLGKEVRV